MFNWLKKRKNDKRRALVNEIASATYNALSGGRGWEKFLPPVVLRDSIYMVTENGSIYRLKYDPVTEMEMVMQIRSN